MCGIRVGLSEQSNGRGVSTTCRLGSGSHRGMTTPDDCDGEPPSDDHVPIIPDAARSQLPARPPDNPMVYSPPVAKGTSKKAKKPAKKRDAAGTRPLTLRLDAQDKKYLERAAEIRRVSVSDYVRAVTVAQARREVESARERTIALTSDEQLAFWHALQAPSELTEAQRRLGASMRGEP